MTKIAVFPGSFDPVTVGHESVVRRALPLFDQIVLAIGVNASKSSFFPLEQRITWLKEVFKEYPSVEITHYQGLTVDFCQSRQARYILRGLRSAVDFEFERNISLMNKRMQDGIETIFLLSEPEHIPINSSIVRDIIRNGGDASPFVPRVIANMISPKP